MLVVLGFESGPGRREFVTPCGALFRRQRISQRFQGRFLAAHDPERDRQVATDVGRVGIDADVRHVRVERVLPDIGHAVLAYEHDQVGAEQGIGSGACGERVVVREVPATRAGLHNGDIGLLGHGLESVPSLAVEDAGTRDDDRTLGFVKHRDRLGDVFRRGVRPGVGAVFRLAVEIAQVLRTFKRTPGDLARKIQMDRTGHAALELPEGVSGVLVDPFRIDQALAVLAHAFRCRLLVNPLDALLGVFQGERHIARKDQQGGAGRVRSRDVHDHVREAWTFRSGCGGHFTGHTGETVGSGAHHALRAAAVAGDPFRGDGVDDRVIARSAEQRRQTLFLARLGEDLGTGHRELGGFGRLREARRHLGRNEDAGVPSLGGRSRRVRSCGSGRRNSPSCHESPSGD